MEPDDHDTWSLENGPDHSSQHSRFDDTYSATKIYRFDPIKISQSATCDEFYVIPRPRGLPYNVAMGILPSIEFSFCPVLRTTTNTYINHCRNYQDYSTASFSYVPERIND